MTEQQPKNKKKYYPRPHSAEHLVSRVIENMFENIKYKDSKVERKVSKVDFFFDRDLSKEEVQKINNETNELIQKNLEVKAELITREDAEKRGFDVSKARGETIRIVKIGEYDSRPCSGDHVSNTKEIGTFDLRTHSFNNGILRIRFRISPL